MSLSQAKIERVLNLIEMKGFFLKRSYSVKLDLAREIMEEVNAKGFTGEEFMGYLESLRPTKAATSKEKAMSEPSFIGSAVASERNRQITDGTKFLVTYAQNETAVHKDFFKSLQRYAETMEARLVVVKGHYNTSAFSGQCKGDSEIYAEELRPYLVDQDHFLGYFQGIYLAAGTNILPTAAYPANAGGALIGNSEAIILGHTKQQAKTLPVMKGQSAKWVYSTGSVTVRNYVPSAAGAKAEADHAYGALIIEVCPESLQWQVRQLRANELDGSFYDLNILVTPHAVLEADPFSMVLGDIHAEKLDQNFWKDTLSFIDAYKPKKLVLHDILDFSSRNHHRRDSGHFLASTIGQTVEDDLAVVSNTLVQLRDVVDSGDLIVVYSNHDDALIRWLDCNKYDPSKDPINAVTYHKLNAAVYSDIINQEPLRPILETALAELQLDSAQATFLLLDQSCSVNGVEVGFHGDKGVNGSKGSPMLYSRQGISMVTGHTHSPSMIGDVTTVGCCNLEQGYNVGMSSWDLCHAVIYPNGYTSLIRL